MAISTFIGSPNVTLNAPFPEKAPSFIAVPFKATLSGDTISIPSTETGCASADGKSPRPAIDASSTAFEPTISSFPESNPV